MCFPSMTGAGAQGRGFAIYRLLAREPAGQRELNDPRVQQTIHQKLHEAQKQLLQTAYLETLQDDARVRNYLAEEILKRARSSARFAGSLLI